MSEPLRRLLRVLLATTVVGLLGCGASAEIPDEPIVTIRDQVVTVEIAKTRAEMAQGLSDRPSLDWHRGMLFVYDEPEILSFWMRRMRFDIDIVWIREGKIIGIANFVPYPREDPTRPATVRSPELADRVLEVPAGYAQAHGWRRGDRVTLDLGTPTTQ